MKVRTKRKRHGFRIAKVLQSHGRYYMRKLRVDSGFRRQAALFGVGLIAFSVYFSIYTNQTAFNKYDITQLEGVLLEEPVGLYANALKADLETGALTFNEGYTPSSEIAGQSSIPKYSAKFATSVGNNSVEITDPVHSVALTMKPLFKVKDPIKNQNRVVYPLRNKKASTIYTLKGTAVKEDLVLFEYQGDTLDFDYQLELPDGLAARIDEDGSVGVYGVDPVLLGNVSAGSEADEKLLKNARSNAEKTTLIFRIPAPFIVEPQRKASTKAKSWFSMPKKNVLRVHASGLKDAKYPLSIDPSVYIETARKFMRGNNESNIDFNVSNELIQKGATTGARFDQWVDTTALNDGRSFAASAATGGYIYTVGGATEGGLVSTVYSSSGTQTYNVPSGVTSISIKVWGAGGGGGGASPDRVGGNGGGGGYAASTVTVTPLEALTVRIGGGGGGGTGSNVGTNSGNGGGGGGYSGVLRSATPLIIASGGGGGGGGNGDTGSSARAPGSPGGAGGDTTGINGTSNGNTTGGNGGTQIAGGGGGTVDGVTGSSLTGGAGGSPGGTATGGGTHGGGAGGIQQNGGGPNKFPGGGGGGGGYFGGGGGGRRNNQYNGGAGGGGGSSYTTGSPATRAAGNGTNPGNINDGDRAGAGDGGGGGAIGGNGTSGDNGLVVISYSAGGSGAVQNEVFWSQINETTGALETPNPGDGSCVSWCTLSDYSLPAERIGHSLVAYNGFLYVFGGVNGSGTRQSTVYIAKLGANGEPQKWHPTDDNKANWVYWYSDTSLPSELAYHSAVAYNNKIYVLGGQTNAASGGINVVRVADVNPTGTLGAWGTTGMTVLPSVRFSHTTQIYNGYMYLLGGNSSGTLQSGVHYTKLNSDGTMNAWNATTSFSTARMTWGGNYTAIWGGYIYLTGGCTAVDGTTGYCTSVVGDTQLASINADGSLTDWNTIIGLTNLRMGHSVVTWRNAIYGIGGCSSQNPIDGQCADVILTNDYGDINQDGDASTVSDSQTSGSGNCTGADPYDCDIPPLGNGDGQGGQMSGGTLVNNGIIYYIGGCRLVAGSQICNNGGASRTADTTYYAAISTDGTLHRVASCTGTGMSFYGSWCVDNNNTLNGSTGLAAFGYAVFNNVIYVVGGTDGANWQANVYRNPLNADGSLGAWSSQTFTDVGLGAAKGYQYVFTRSNPTAAATFPGNLYVLGGCNGSSAGLDCNNTIYTDVYKCKISTTGALGTGGDACTTSGQLQLDSEPNTGGSQGLGVMAGTVYANYIYLIGGQSPNQTERGQVMYARLDNSNNIVAVSGGIWQTSSYQLNPSRRRGVAFGYNGYLYGLAGFANDTGLNDLLFAKIDVSNGSIGAFTTSTVTVNQRWDLRGVVSSGYVYTFGGCSAGEPPATCNSMTSTVQTFQLYNNYSGSTTNYVSSANRFTTDRIGGSAAVLNGYLYIAGGCTSASDSPCTDTTSSVQYAALDSAGAVGSWSATTNSLPADRAWGQLEAAGGYLYYLGGQDDTATNEQSTVYYAQPSSGDITSWSTASGGIGDTSGQAAQPRTRFGATVWNDRIYVVGGLDGSASATSTVFYSPQLSSGGNIAADSWTADANTHDVARFGATIVSYANNLYLIGGNTGSNYLNDVQFTQINSNGSIDSWSYTSSLPQRVSGADGFAYNGYMYLFGGRSADTTCTANTYVSPISANTTIASGNNPTGLGEWYQTREKLDGAVRYGAAAAYSEGKAYVLGGGCGSTLTLTGNDRVLYATLQSQPQMARFSKMIDTDSDVFPTKWLMNGLDNDIGARWLLNYRSSTDANDAWGLNTNFGRVTLGSVENYTPLNGVGTDTDFARYYYFSVSIDSSQAYGYPDDVTRGPTIDDLTLFFTSDPNKRLRHGKTFTGGEKQPLDTPPPN